jgi:hypothetical protein
MEISRGELGDMLCMVDIGVYNVEYEKMSRDEKIKHLDKLYNIAIAIQDEWHLLSDKSKRLNRIMDKIDKIRRGDYNG